MVIFLKIISALFVWLLPIGVFIRDWKFKDSRTKLYRRINIILLAIGTIGAILSSYFIIVEEFNSKENTSRLVELQKSNDSLLTQNALLQISIDSMNLKNENLVNTNKDFLTKMNYSSAKI